MSFAGRRGISRPVNPAPIEGDLLVYAGGVWVTLSPATDGHVLTSQGPGVAPAFEVVSAGTMNHAALSSNLAWTSSGHTGTASRVAGFNGGGAAAYLVIGGDLQGYHANLTAFAGLSLVADRLPYADGSGTLALTTLSAYARSFLDDPDEATFKATVNLEIGVDVQAYSAILAAFVALGLPLTPWHVLGTIAGAMAWLPRMPETGARGGFVVNLSATAGASAINANVFQEDAASSGLTTTSSGSFRYLTTSAILNDARGWYCNGNARAYSVETGFLFAGRIRIATLTDVRYVFAMCEDTGVVGLLDDITSGDTQTTRLGFFLVISSTTGVPGTVSAYSSASGAASALASTGIVAAVGEVLDVYLMSGNGALGASKTIYWQVVRRTNTEATATGSFTTNLPASSSTMRPAFAVRTLAAASINIEAQSLSVAE